MDQMCFGSRGFFWPMSNPLFQGRLPLLIERTGNCEFSIAVKNDGDRERLRQLASDIQSEGVARARRTILGTAA